MHNIDKIIGNRIRLLRESQGYTQDLFASECGISRAYYGRLERGEHSMTISTCQLIAKTLGILMSDIFTDLKI